MLPYLFLKQANLAHINVLLLDSNALMYTKVERLLNKDTFFIIHKEAPFKCTNDTQNRITIIGYKTFCFKCNSQCEKRFWQFMTKLFLLFIIKIQDE